MILFIVMNIEISARRRTYVTSLSFEMEPECYGEEDGSPQNITQIPFECILDEFNVYVTDFYDQLNAESETMCYQEFGSNHLSNIQKLRILIDKRFYAVPYSDDEGSLVLGSFPCTGKSL